MASPASSSLPDPRPGVPPTQIMRRFIRACGCFESLIWTVGDHEQAARYEATACQFCRPVTRKHGRGRGGNR